MTPFQFVHTIVVPRVTFHQGQHRRASADNKFFMQRPTCTTSTTRTGGIYTFLILDEFIVPCRLQYVSPQWIEIYWTRASHRCLLVTIPSDKEDALQ